jgi:uncharacterized protein with HEPN domain
MQQDSQYPGGQYSDGQYLVDMLHCAQRILDYVADSSIHDFYENIQLQDSVIRKLLSIGKAASRISTETRQGLRGIDWQAMDEMKSRLMHDEQAIDADRLWRILKTEAPKLVQALRSQVLAEDNLTAETASLSSQEISQL